MNAQQLIEKHELVTCITGRFATDEIGTFDVAHCEVDALQYLTLCDEILESHANGVTRITVVPYEEFEAEPDENGQKVPGERFFLMGTKTPGSLKALAFACGVSKLQIRAFLLYFRQQSIMAMRPPQAPQLPQLTPEQIAAINEASQRRLAMAARPDTEPDALQKAGIILPFGGRRAELPVS